MNKGRFLLGVLIIVFFLSSYIFVSKCFGNDLSTYSSKDISKIGAWYDDEWQASAFYRLENVANANINLSDYKYKYTTNSVTDSTTDTTFTKNGSDAERTTEEKSSHDHKYNDQASGASLPQDIVITEWKVTGHVHFSSGMQ